MRFTIYDLRFTRWLLLCAFCAFLRLPSEAATVTGTINNATGTGYAARLSFVPLSNPQVLTNTVLTAQVVNKTCAANGTFTQALQQGDYRVQIDNADRFLISVPNTTNTYQLTALITQSLLFQFKFPYLPMDLNGYTNSITNLNTISASNGIFSLSLRLPRLTQTQRDAYTATNGLVILNTTTGALNFYDGTNWLALGTTSGTVTSVGLSVPAWLSVSGSPVTNSGTVTVTAAGGQTANWVLATPDGSSGALGPRALVAADIPSLDAAKIGSGTIATARLGTGTANSTTVLLGSQAYAQIADAQVASGAAIGWAKLDKTGSSLADLATRSAADLSSGTIATARLGSGTANSTTVLLGSQAYAQIADAQVASGAAIGWAKLDKTGSSLADLATRSASDLSSGTVAAARLGTIQTTTDGGSHSFKMKDYIVLVSPHNCDGVGAIIATNDNTKPFFGQAAFSASAATNANWIEYRLTVPEDLDPAVDLKIERWKVRLGAGDTNAHTYNIGMASVADSSSYDSPTLGQWVALSLSADASGASADVETVSNVTLSGWRSNMTAGQLLVIRVNRDGAGDSSTQTSYSGPLVISFGRTQ